MHSNTKNKSIIFILIFLISLFNFALNTSASGNFTFTKNLDWGSKGTEVKVLQQFLINEGVYSGPVTGNYYSLTSEGVKNFQKKEGISPISGYFGPLSRIKANQILSVWAQIDSQSSGGLNAISSTSPSPTTNVVNPQSSSNGILSVPSSQLEANASSAYNSLNWLTWRTNKNSTTTTNTNRASTPKTNQGTTPNLVGSTGTSGTLPTTLGGTTTTTNSNNSTTPISGSGMLWGAYVGDGSSSLSSFETLVGKSAKLYADFEGWENPFPSGLSSTVGQKGKTLIIFWEPDFGYDAIIDGSKDAYIKQFAASAKSYKYEIILAPFDEMNLNENSWGYGANGNNATKFKTAWQHMHDLFNGVTNVKFAITYNNVSVPSVAGNKFSDYYPGDNYVDYVGVDGFNFGNPWQTFAQTFDSAIDQLSKYGKPIYIMSMGSVPGTQKATWITEGLGSRIKAYSKVVGWVWFNQNGADGNWLVNSDPASLSAFKLVI